MSLKFTFKNINRVASLNVIRQIVPIYSSRVFETTRRWKTEDVISLQLLELRWQYRELSQFSSCVFSLRWKMEG